MDLNSASPNSSSREGCRECKYWKYWKASKCLALKKKKKQSTWHSNIKPPLFKLKIQFFSKLFATIKLKVKSTRGNWIGQSQQDHTVFGGQLGGGHSCHKWIWLQCPLRSSVDPPSLSEWIVYNSFVEELQCFDESKAIALHSIMILNVRC